MKGQSLIELAFTTPILFLMIVSTAEVGYLANNYLILLDALQQGGRHAVTLSPLTWDEQNDSRNRYRTACWDDGDAKNPGVFTGLYNLRHNQVPGLSAYHGPAAFTKTSNPEPGPVGFFDSTACQVIGSMDPLQLDVSTGAHDDIVVSAIAYMNNCTSGPCINGQVQIGTRKLIVTGRWPLLNRMCSGERDPFVYPGVPPLGVNDVAPPAADGTFRGFVITGNSPEFTHGGCYGSKFNVDSGDAYDLDIVLNNLPNSAGSSTSILKSVPNGGMVIVEASWKHHQLFGFPPMNFLGNPDLYLFQFFPISAAEPTPTPAPTYKSGP